MPTNLPPDAQAKWTRAQDARDPKEKAQLLQEFLSSVPKHKHTEKLRAQVKHKIAVLRRQVEEQKKRKTGSGPKFFVEKEGAAQVVILGLAGVGKSSLLSALTNAKAEIGTYPYTTKQPVPGMLPFEDIQLQLVDTPSLIRGAADGLGWGPQVLAMARNADAIMIAVDASYDPVEQLHAIVGELEKARILVSRPKALIEIERGRTGAGLQIILSGRLAGFTGDDVRRLLEAYKLRDALVKIEGEATLEDIENAILESSTYRPAMVVATKTDMDAANENMARLLSACPPDTPIFRVSCKTGEGLGDIGRAIFKHLRIMRIYTKQPGEDASASHPLTMTGSATVIDIAKRIHSHLWRKFKYARLWGPSAKYPGERVGALKSLRDGDIVEIHIK